MPFRNFFQTAAIDGHKPCPKLACCLVIIALAIFTISANINLLPGYGWHDQQRILQLSFITVTICLAPLLPLQRLSKAPIFALALLLIIGLVSGSVSAYPEWAYKEWARYAGLALLALSVGGLAHQQGQRYPILWIMAIAGCLHAFQFTVYYAAAFISSIHILDADLLYGGFSNPRFFGQFQVLLLPVLALLVRHCQRHRQGLLAIFLGSALAIHWCIAFSLGGRGLWLGLFVSHLAAVLINRNLWPVIAVQVVTALLGSLIFLLLLKLIPLWLGLDPILRDSLRTGLSGRQEIWESAWQMALSNPWLGVGPMHFAATYNPIAAHPHQVVLQWLAEWGFAATIIAIALSAWGLAHGALFLRRYSATELDAGLWISITGALVLAQVDGVFVMPYTETWLALLIGLALARWTTSAASATRTQRIACCIAAIPIAILLGKTVIIDAPSLPQTEEAHLTEHHTGLKPRFWLQGWIPMQR